MSESPFDTPETTANRGTSSLILSLSLPLSVMSKKLLLVSRLTCVHLRARQRRFSGNGDPKFTAAIRSATLADCQTVRSQCAPRG